MLITTWFEWLQDTNTSALVLMLSVLGAASVAMVAIVASAWRRGRESDNRTALASMMLQRGMSAEEVERVVRACQLTADEQAECDPEAQLISLMKESDYTTEDVERVLDAARYDGRIDAATVKVVEGLVEQGVEGAEIETLLDARRPRPPRAVRAG